MWGSERLIKTLKVERISIETKAKDSRLGVGVSKTYRCVTFQGDGKSPIKLKLGGVGGSGDRGLRDVEGPKLSEEDKTPFYF